MNTRKHPCLPGSAENQTGTQKNTNCLNSNSISGPKPANAKPASLDQHIPEQREAQTSRVADPAKMAAEHAEVNECSPAYNPCPDNQALPNTGQQNTDQHLADKNTRQTINEDAGASGGLNLLQQQFVLKFCRQLVSVIEACEQSESAEIEVGRRQIDNRQIKVKLQAEREFSHPAAAGD